MGLISLSYNPAGTDARSISSLMGNLNTIVSEFNGNIDNANIKASAGIVDSKLASPNNSVWRTILTYGMQISSSVGAGVYNFPAEDHLTWYPSATPSAGGSPIVLWNVNSADYAVAGKTTYIRTRAVYASNATALGQTITTSWSTFTVAGTFNVVPRITYTIGSGGGALSIPSPAASSITTATLADTALPSNGTYAFYVSLGGAVPSDHLGHLKVLVEMRNV